MIKKIKNTPGLHIKPNHRLPLVIVSLILMIFNAIPCFAVPPVITNFTTDTNETSSYIQVNSGTVITFNVTAVGATSYNWYIDNRLNGIHTNPFPLTVTGYHTIKVTAQNVDGNSTPQYKAVVINQVTASATVAPLNDSYYYEFEGLLASPDVLGIIQLSPKPYVDRMGSVFYLLLWGLIGFMMWIRSEKITVIATLLFIVGGVFIATLPPEYQLIVQLIAVGGIFAVLMSFAKERR